MLFFAWSLVLSAVNYARRQRLTSILEKHLYLPYSSETGLICKKIEKKIYGNTLTIDQDSGVDSSSSSSIISNSLIKAPSESNINYDKSSIILYRTENYEILAVSKPESLKITDWSLFTDEIKKSIFISQNSPKISFIAVINVNDNYTGSQDELNKFFNFEFNQETGKNNQENDNNLNTESYAGIPPILISSIANQIAFNRNKPYEVLYETDLNNFYTIVFQWSESALYEFSGRGIVKEIYTVQLPDLTQKSDNFAQVIPYASTGALTLPNTFKSRVNRKPFTLLEYLYLKDLFGDNIDNSNEWRMLNVVPVKMNEYSFYRSDSALNRAISPPGSLYGSLKRRTQKSLPPINPPSTRSKSAKRSISPDISSEKSIPLYLQELRRQNDTKIDRRRTCSLNSSTTKISGTNCYCSPSTTYNDILDDIKYIDYSSIEEESTTIPSTTTPKLSTIKKLSINSNLSLPSTARTPTNKIQKELETFILNQKNIDTSKNGSIYINHQNGNNQNKNKESDVIKNSKKYNWKRRLSTHLKFQKMTETLSKKFHLNINYFNDNTLNSDENVPHPRKRFASLIPDNQIQTEFDKQQHFNMFNNRRRSLSPLTLSIVANYVNYEPTTLANTAAIGAQSRLIANHENFIRRRSCTPTRRRFQSIPTKPNGVEANNSIDKVEPRPPQKPPTILVYTANDNDLFKRIFDTLIKILPVNTYTIFNLTTKALINEPWMDENATCLLLADTKHLGDLAWSRLQSYFIHSGRIIFLCQNSLLANLTNCESVKKQANLLKNAFGNKNASISLGKDFEVFLKKSMKTLTKTKEINETFHAKDIVGGYRYSVVLHKKLDNPLLLYMENSENNASALFSDATIDELLKGGGTSLIADIMKRLNIKLIDNLDLPKLTQGYFICEPDKLIFDMNGIDYGNDIGDVPKLHFQSGINIKEDPKIFPNVTSELLPIEVCKRRHGYPDNVKFNLEKYYNKLKTKSLGKAIIYVPVCESTIPIAKSLLSAIPTYDGILIIAGNQINGKGRSGNQWLSPEGCAMFTFNFNIPLNSKLGQSACFIQHILAVSIVDAIYSLLNIKNFGLKIKWPNDIYFNRSFKMGGILVTSSISSDILHCSIGAGINVSNSKPTVCVNDMLPEDCENILNVEEVIAETMNKFEYYVHLFENSGKEAFLKKYYEYWLHTREEVTIQNYETGTKERVIIRGLDTFGYLEVRSKQTGKVFSVHDNGNTFDMMKGLIRPKDKA